LVDWLVGWLIDCLFGRLVGWLFGWLVDWLASYLLKLKTPRMEWYFVRFLRVKQDYSRVKLFKIKKIRLTIET
jgi:membrane-associated phospholipid phosphatase